MSLIYLRRILKNPNLFKPSGPFQRNGLQSNFKPSGPFQRNGLQSNFKQSNFKPFRSVNLNRIVVIDHTKHQKCIRCTNQSNCQVVNKFEKIFRGIGNCTNK